MRYYLICLMTCLCLAVDAQTERIPDMKFRRLDTQDGLSSSQVSCVFKDSRGFVWFGTPYGLNRYDGYRIKTYYSNIRDTTSMRDNYTDKVFEAFDGKLWLKQGMNYCVYDPATETFERNAAREMSKYGQNCSIERLYIDSKKNFWIKDWNGFLLWFNPKAKKKTKFKVGYEKNELNPDYGISSIAEAGNSLVIATFKGELVCLNGEKGIVEWENSWMREHGSPENQDYHLVIDRNGNYWCVCLENTYIYIHSENRWYTTAKEYLEAQGIEGLPALQVWDLHIDAKGWLWLACDHEGLIVIDLKSKQWKQFKNSKYDETTISENTLRNMYFADDGSVWIGTYKNGVNQYVPGLSSLKTVELGNINTVCEDKYGNYWAGSDDNGIIVYNPEREEIVNHFTKDNSGLAGNIMVGSYPASDGTLWFGSYNGGLSHVIPSAEDPTQATIVNYQASEGGLANNSVWDLTEDKWGRIWFSTLGGGLQMLDPKTMSFTTWNSKNAGAPSDYMTSVKWTKKGWLLLGTSFYYALVNPTSGKFVNQQLPEDPSITVTISSTTYVLEDSRGLIWQGSSSGLTMYDPKTKFITLIDMSKGLYGSGINAILEDKKHTIWISTEHGVSSIAPQQQEDGTWQFNIRSFNSRDGLQKATYNQRSMWLTSKGKVLVGGQGGLDIIDPNSLIQKTSKARPVFSGLQVFDQDVPVGKEVDGRVILDEALDYCRDITLKFNDQFTIQLATTEVVVKNHRRFAYKLEGFNENWVKTSEQNPNITYNSLRAGSYTLCVRILNEDGTLGAEESRMDITIVPPLWRTRWMLLLYMVAIASLAAGSLWLFFKRQRERNALEELRRETEKKRWMSEVRQQVAAELEMAMGRPAQSAEGGAGEAAALHKVNTDLVSLFRDVCDKFVPPSGKSIRLSFFPFVDNLVVMVDRDRMRQMLQILLTNAATFSPNNSKVKVYVEKQDGHAILRVADSGVGIPDEAKDNLFIELMGDDDSPNLHVVFEVVTEHGGTISADENHGGGTVFTISLPIEDPDVEEAVIIED